MRLVRLLQATAMVIQRRLVRLQLHHLLTHQVLKKLVIIFMQQHLTLVHLMELVKIYQSQAARLHLDILKCQM